MSRITPNRTAFEAPELEARLGSWPIIWKPGQTDGRTTCKAIAAAARVTIWAMIHGPAGKPADHRATEPAGPLVDRPRDRVSSGQLSETQGHRQLAHEHDRPGPEECRTAEAEAQTEQLEDGRHDRHERETRGERGEGSDPPFELLDVAKGVQVSGSAVGDVRLMPAKCQQTIVRSSAMLPKGTGPRTQTCSGGLTSRAFIPPWSNVTPM